MSYSTLLRFFNTAAAMRRPIDKTADTAYMPVIAESPVFTVLFPDVWAPDWELSEFCPDALALLSDALFPVDSPDCVLSLDVPPDVFPESQIGRAHV